MPPSAQTLREQAAEIAVLQASKMRRLIRLGVVVTIKNGMAVYSYPITPGR